MGERDAEEEEEEAEDAEAQELHLRFTGNLREYFRVWAVSTLLTIVTLGVFSAWAKVRKKRYLYAHTVIDGTPLRYLGRPLPILKGRLVALMLVAIWYVVTRHYHELLWPLAIVALFVVPWMIVRTAAFTARSTSYRNIGFDFKSNYKQALGLFLGGGAIVALTLGLAYPWFQFKLRSWLVGNTYYGQERCTFVATPRQFYSIYAVVWALGAVVVGLFAVVLGSFFGDMLRWTDGLDMSLRFMVFAQYLMAAAYLAYLLAAFWLYTAITNRVWRSTHLGPLAFGSALRATRVAWVYASNAVLVLGSAGLLMPWATLRLLRYRLSCVTLHLEGELGELRGARTQLPSAAGAEAAEVFDLELSL